MIRSAWMQLARNRLGSLALAESSSSVRVRAACHYVSPLRFPCQVSATLLHLKGHFASQVATINLRGEQSVGKKGEGRPGAASEQPAQATPPRPPV